MTWEMQMALLPQLLVNALITGSIYAMVACGLSLTYSLLRVINFAHGHLVMAGAYACFFFLNHLGQGLPVAVLGTVFVMAALAWITFGIFVRPFTKGGALLTFVTTVCLGSMLEAMVALLFGVNTQVLNPDFVPESMQFGSVFVTSVQLTIIGVVFVLLSLSAGVLHASSTGRMLRAMASQKTAAQSLGIPSHSVERNVFIAATIFAGIAGILIGYETNLQPTMGTPYTIKAFAAMILGGLGNLWGTLAGSYLLGLFENLAVGLEFGGFSIPSGYRDAVAYGVILLMLLFKPSGLFVRGGRKV